MPTGETKALPLLREAWKTNIQPQLRPLLPWHSYIVIDQIQNGNQKL